MKAKLSFRLLFVAEGVYSSAALRKHCYHKLCRPACEGHLAIVGLSSGQVESDWRDFGIDEIMLLVVSPPRERPMQPPLVASQHVV